MYLKAACQVEVLTGIFLNNRYPLLNTLASPINSPTSVQIHYLGEKRISFPMPTILLSS